MQQQEHTAAVIARALDKLISEGTDGSYLIVAIDEVYFQFLSIGDLQQRRLYCEAVSNEFLPEGQKLEPEQITALVFFWALWRPSRRPTTVAISMFLTLRS